jgi:hypothetical protein
MDKAVIVYPPCPKGELLTEDLFKTGKGLEVLAAELEDIENAHIVGLAVVVVVHVQEKVVTPKDTPVVIVKPSIGSWGKKLELKTETAEETERREEQNRLDAIRRRREKEDADADSNARRLVQRIEAAIKQGNFTNSANFPKDREYGFKQGGGQTTANADVIDRASVIWLLKGANYAYRSPHYKKSWGQTMANFEKLMTSGVPDDGKHNFHVVLV